MDSPRGARLTPGLSVPEQGRLVPNDAPGFGIELRLEELQAARV